MRIKIDASPTELSEKGDALIQALVRSLTPACPELAERLEKALPEPQLKLRHRALRDIHKITKEAYRKTLEAMHLDIARVLDEAANATSAGQEFQKAWGEERPGHKYKSRRRGPSGEWQYEYDEPAQGDLFAQALAPAPHKRQLLQILDNDPALTKAQKEKPQSEALREIMAKPASDPGEWKLPAGARLDPWVQPPVDPEAVWSHPDYGEGKGQAPWEVGEDWRPDLHRYDHIVINSSAGKDSQAMLTHTVELAKQQGYPLDKIVVVHADLGRVEWEGTKELAQQQAEHYGLTFKVVRREKDDLIEQIESRHGDLQQKTLDAAKLAEAGIKTWRQLAGLSDEDVTRIIGEGKGKSQWEGKNRAGKLLRGVGGVQFKVQKKIKTHTKQLADAEERVARWAGKVESGKTDKARDNAKAKLQEARENLAQLKEKGDPWDWPIAYGQEIAWPSSESRYCTADHKRAEVDKLITKMAEELREKGHKGTPRILNALGIRAQEGENRASMANFERAKTTSNQIVDDWFPIHRWPEEKVWSTIAKSGVPYHKAYALGMRRLSCVFCVFASREDLMVAATHNPHLFRTYLDLEERVGSSFKADHSLAEVADEIKRRRDAGYDLNELAEWVKKALGLDDVTDALVKAELEHEDPNLVLMVLEAALVRLAKHGQAVRTVAIDWKGTGACVHLDTEADSHHVLWLTYPEAYRASIVAAAFAQKHSLRLEENNAPAPVPPEEELAKSFGAQRAGHKYIRREGSPGHYEYVYAAKAKPRYHKLSGWALSHFETEVRELAEDPEAHGLSPEEAEDYKVLHESVDYDKGTFRLPDHPKAADRMHTVLTEMINLHDEHAEKDEEPEQRKMARAQRDGLSTLANKVLEPLRKEERQSPEQMELFAEAADFGVDLGGYFPSGSNHKGEIEGFHELGWNVGVAVDALDKQGHAEEALKQLAGTKTKVFVDSGAFGEMYANFPKSNGEPRKYPDKPIGLIVLKPISHEEWLKRLATYSRLADSLGSQLYAVAPDRVADQEVTKERMTRYIDEVKAIRAKGANILVPLQKGAQSLADFDKWVANLIGDENYVRAIPMKKDATSTEDLRGLLQERKPARIHLLGLGEKSERYPEIMAMVKEVSPHTIVTMDSVAITAAVGRDKETGKPRKLTAAQDRTREQLSHETHEAESGADYTEHVYTPSEWAGKALRQRGAQRMGTHLVPPEPGSPEQEPKVARGLDPQEARAFIRDPDKWIQEHPDHPGLDEALDSMWQEYMMDTGTVAEQKRRAVHEAFGGKGRIPERSYQAVTAAARADYLKAKASGEGAERARAHLADTAYQHAIDVYQALQSHELSPEKYDELHAPVFGPRESFNPTNPKWRLQDPDLEKPAEEIAKAMGPFIGPRGGKWADAEHTIHWEEAVPHEQIVEQAHAAVKEHVTEGAMRAAAVGADAASLKYVGAGGEGMIFEDGKGRAYKVSRFRSKARPDKLRNEAEAMMALADSPVAHMVPKVHGYDEKHDVISRDMIQGASAGWGQSDKLHEAYKQIAAELSKRGWYAPEFKEDSFVIPQDGSAPIMVDMGFVHPKGKVLAAQLKRRVENLNPKDDWFDFQLDVSHAYQDGAIDVTTALKYLGRGGQGIENAQASMVDQALEGLAFTARGKGDLKAGQTWHDIPKPKEPKPKRKPGMKSGEELRRAKLLSDGYGQGPIEADAPLAKAEEAIRGQEHEHAAIYDADGKMLFRLTSGMVDACEVSPVHANRIKDNGNVTFTHNHPKNGCVSMQDIALTVLLNIKEMRAVCTNGVTFVLTRPEGGWEKRGDWRTLFTAATNLGNGRASARMDARIRAAGGKPGYPDSPGYSEEVWDEFRHEEGFKAIKEAADGLGWGFRSEGTKRSVADPGGASEKRDQPGQGQPGDLPGAVAPTDDGPPELEYPPEEGAHKPWVEFVGKAQGLGKEALAAAKAGNYADAVVAARRASQAWGGAEGNAEKLRHKADALGQKAYWVAKVKEYLAKRGPNRAPVPVKPALELTPEPAPKPKPKRTPVPIKPPEEEAAKPLPGQLSLLGGPPVPGKRKVRKPVQQVLFAEPEKPKPEDKPLPGQLPLIPRR